MDVVSDDDPPALVTALSLHVAGNAHGAIYLPALSPTASITIDGSLASGTPGGGTACGCDALGVCEGSLYLGAQDSGATSPRETGIREAGLIAITAARGLQGTIVINAGNVEGGEWAEAAEIIVGSVSLSPNPDYAGSSLAYGGGVVGVVPFRHYVGDAFPMELRDSEGELLKESTIRANDSGSAGALRLRFYGPLVHTTDSDDVGAAVKVQRETSTDVWTVDTAWVATLAPVAFNGTRREVQLHRTSEAPGGHYRVVHGLIPHNSGGSDTELSHLACAGLADGAPAADVPNFSWCFTVSSGEYNECYATLLDYNGDTVVNPDDLGDYITDYYTVPDVSGPGGYAIYCPENAPPYDLGYKAAFPAVDTGGQCNPPFSDNLGDYITAYYGGC